MIVFRGVLSVESKSISNEGFVLWMDKTIGPIGILNGNCGSVVKNLPADARDTGSIPGLGRSPGVGNGNPL